MLNIQQLTLKGAIATVLLGIFTSASAAPAKHQPTNTFDYDDGLTAYANAKAGRAIIPKNLVGFYCIESTHESEQEFHCDVWTQGHTRTHRYVVTVPQGLNGQRHQPLAKNGWELVRSPAGKGRYAYTFNSQGGPERIARKAAETDFGLFVKSIMKDVAVMQGNESRFLEQVRKRQQAQP